MNDRDIYMNAPEDPGEGELAAYLDAACGGDAELRSRVEALFGAAERAGEGFLAAGPSAGEPELSRDQAAEPVIEREGSVVGKYKLLQAIGEGGFGVVYMAEQQRPVKRRVAFKLIKPGMDSKQVVARFEAERQALALMDHPNIAKVHDAGETAGGRPYFVMELVKGVPITEFCDEHQLSTDERLELFTDVCRAVQHAHQKGVIHRDLKPSNVMVTLHDDKAVVKVIDFGVAKATQTDLTDKTLFTMFEQFIGTPAYMSPEQAQLSGLDIDTRSDIYALGVLLYELLTGRTPFDQKELLSAGYDEMRRVIREDEPPKPSTRMGTLGDAELTDLAKHRKSVPDKLRGQLRGDLDWIVMKALEKDRTRRYETANALAMDVGRHLADEPVVAAKPSTAYQFQKYARRHRTGLLAGAAVSIALLGGTAVSIYQTIQAKGAHHRESAERMKAVSERARAVQGENRALEGERRQRLLSYASDMKLAQNDLAANNLGRVSMLLDRYVPKPGEDDIRGIEWRYLWQASRGDELRSIPCSGIVNCVSLNEAGDLIASVTLEGDVQLFDVTAGKVLRRFRAKALHDQIEASLSLSPDGSMLAADRQGSLVVWDVKSGVVRFEFEGVVAPLAFSPDSRLLAGVTPKGLTIWNTSDWSLRRLGGPLPIAHYRYRSVAFSPDTSKVVFCRRRLEGSSEIEVWDLDSGEMLGNLEGLQRACSLAVGDSVVAGGGWGGVVLVWDLGSRELKRSINAHHGIAAGLAISSDGSTLATGGSDQVIKLWDLQTFDEKQSLSGHRSEIWSLKFSGDGHLLVSASKDRTIKLWSTGAKRRTNDVMLAIPEELWAFGYTPTGNQVRFYDRERWLPEDDRAPERVIRLLDLDAGQWTPFQWELGAQRKIEWFRCSSAEEAAIFGGDDGVVVLARGGSSRELQVSEYPVEADRLSPRGNYFVARVTPPRAQPFAVLIDTQTGETVRQFPGIYEITEPQFTFSNDERLIAYAHSDFSIELWSIAERRTWAKFQGHPWRIYDLEFSADDRLLASGSWDGDCRVWDVEKGTAADPHIFRGHLSGVPSVRFSPDGRTLATLSDDRSIKFWNVATGQEMLSFGIHRDVRTLYDRVPAFTPDGNRLVWVEEHDGRTVLRVTRMPTLDEIDAKLGEMGFSGL